MVLTVSFVISPVIGLVCHRRQQVTTCQLDASVEASGPHDFAVRVSTFRQACCPRPPHPEPDVRDDRDTPLSGSEMAGDIEVIWGTRERQYFLQRDWTARNRLIALDKLGFARGDKRAPRRRCKAQRDEAMKRKCPLAAWIASLALAMTRMETTYSPVCAASWFETAQCASSP